LFFGAESLNIRFLVLIISIEQYFAYTVASPYNTLLPPLFLTITSPSYYI